MTLFNEAIRLNKADGEALLNRGNIHFDAGRLDSALADYNAALALDPGVVKALVNRGALRARQGLFDLALEDYAKAQEADSSYDQIYFNRGITYHFMNKPREAIADYRKYLGMHPADAGIMNSIALCQVALGDFAAAIDTYTKAIGLEENAVYYQNRAFAWYKLNDFPKALSDVYKAQSLGATVSPTLLNALETGKK